MTPPSMAAWNLALRFGLELAALGGLAAAAWRGTSGWLRWPAMVVVPLAAAVIWATFNVPDDPSRSGEAPVPVPGSLRLFIELGILGLGAAAFTLVDRTEIAIGLAILIVIHYATSVPRIEWLLAS